MVNRREHEDPGRLPLIVPGAGGCWIYTRAVSGNGYPQVWDRSPDRGRMVARVVWEYFNGPMPAGFEPDHTCHVRACVNPGHLEAVPRRVNKQRPRRRTGNRYCAPAQVQDAARPAADEPF